MENWVLKKMERKENAKLHQRQTVQLTLLTLTPSSFAKTGAFVFKMFSSDRDANMRI